MISIPLGLLLVAGICRADGLGPAPEPDSQVLQNCLTGPLTLFDNACADFEPVIEEGEPLFERVSAAGSLEDRPYWRRNLFKRFWGDQKFLVTKWWPAEVRRFGFSVPLLVAVGGASSSSTGGEDLQWQRRFQGWADSGGGHEIAAGISQLGDTKSGVLLVGGTYLLSRWTGNERLQRASSLSAEAVLDAMVYTEALKKLTRRTRPRAGGTGTFFVDSAQEGQSPNSFPSGHAMGAFAIAAVVAHEYRDRPWVRWVAYGSASLVAISRVALGGHFPSDVLAGSVIGHSMGSMVAYRAGLRGEERAHWSTRIEPLFVAENGGYGLAYRHAW